MGNCYSGKDQWIAKETFHPSEDLTIEDLPLLQITKDDKLKLIDDNKFIDRDMYIMRNLNTKQTGLVAKMFIAKTGTIESEP